MRDRTGKLIRAGQQIRVTEQWIDSLVSPGIYRVRFDPSGNLIILPGVAIKELPSAIVEITESKA